MSSFHRLGLRLRLARYPDRSRPRYSAALVAQFPAWDLNKSALEELWRRPAPEQFPDWGKARIQEVAGSWKRSPRPWLVHFPFSPYLGIPLPVMFFLGHGCVVLGLCCIDAVRQPSLFPGLSRLRRDQPCAGLVRGAGHYCVGGG